MDHRLFTNLFQRIVNLQMLRLLKDCWLHRVMICGHMNDYMLPYLHRSANICCFLLTWDGNNIWFTSTMGWNATEIGLLNWRVDPGLAQTKDFINISENLMKRGKKMVVRMCLLVSLTKATNYMPVSDKTVEAEPVKNILDNGSCVYCSTDEKYLCSFQFICW